MMTAPDLLALDWGTSSVRAFLMRSGQVLETRQSACGIQHLPTPGVAGFEQALAELAGDWLRQWPRLPLVAGGMVGSAQGWREAPYVPCPADLPSLAAKCVTVSRSAGPDLLIAPGVIFDAPGHAPDVMRGEEVQIAGALRLSPGWKERCRFVLPGTHSKWVQVEGGRIVRLATYLTGEVFAVLCRHSILGRLMPPANGAPSPSDAAAFGQGLAAARDSGPGELLHQLFATRTLGLTGRLPAASLADFLSGLLIGHEIVSGLAGMMARPEVPLVLIGDGGLCRRYRRSLQSFGIEDALVLDNTAAFGLWDLAGAAGILHTDAARTSGHRSS